MAQEFAELTWTEAEGLGTGSTVALFPVGAVEAHGPHLPLSTDGIIADAMARSAAELLDAEGYASMLLPRLAYGAAPFAAAFPGTVSVCAELVTETVLDVARALVGRVACLGLANAHLDPAQLAALHAATEEAGQLLPVAFPDLTRRDLAQRLGEEFQSGACHAGRFETSIVLAVRPELVRERRRELPQVEISLSEAIHRGEASFEEAGLEHAYCGDPAAASAEEGHERIEALGAILAEEVLKALNS